MSKTWWTVDDLAARWGKSRSSVERLIKSGDVLAQKIGGSWRVHSEALAEYESAGVPRTRREAAKFRTVPDVLGRRAKSVT